MSVTDLTSATTAAELFVPFQDIPRPKESQKRVKRKKLEEGMKHEEGRSHRESMKGNEAGICRPKAVG